MKKKEIEKKIKKFNEEYENVWDIPSLIKLSKETGVSLKQLNLIAHNTKHELYNLVNDAIMTIKQFNLKKIYEGNPTQGAKYILENLNKKTDADYNPVTLQIGDNRSKNHLNEKKSTISNEDSQ